jgi:hypothetical protein
MAKALEEQQGLSDCDRLSFDERLAMLVAAWRVGASLPTN